MRRSREDGPLCQKRLERPLVLDCPEKLPGTNCNSSRRVPSGVRSMITSCGTPSSIFPLNAVNLILTVRNLDFSWAPYILGRRLSRLLLRTIKPAVLIHLGLTLILSNPAGLFRQSESLQKNVWLAGGTRRQ